MMNNSLKIAMMVAFLSFVGLTAHAQRLLLNNVGEPIPPKDSATIARVLNYELEFFNTYHKVDTLKVQLRIFSNKLKMAEYMLNAGYDNAGGLPAGLYIPTQNEAVVLKPQTRDYKPILYHEICHYLSSQAIGRVPRWLSEGLSSYFEQVVVQKKTIVPALPAFSKGQLRSAYNLDEIDLRKIVSWGYSEFYKDSNSNQELPYTLSHGIVYFLVTQKREAFNRIVVCIKSGCPSVEAFNRSYDEGFEQFERDFYDFVFL